MHDQALVRVLHRGADLAEQLDAGSDGQAPCVAVGHQGAPVDLLHDEIGQAVLGGAGVIEAGDQRMLQAGQDLPLGEEAVEDEVAVHAAPDDLERDAPGETSLLVDSGVDRSHAAVAQLADDTVGADPLARARLLRESQSREGHRLFEKLRIGFSGREERLDLAA